MTLWKGLPLTTRYWPGICEARKYPSHRARTVPLVTAHWVDEGGIFLNTCSMPKYPPRQVSAPTAVDRKVDWGFCPHATFGIKLEASA